jgi:hypothetical protein
MNAMLASDLPLPRIGRGKVRDIYAVGDDRVLLLTTDRISAFDVVMSETIPMKGAVLTQISAWWFRQLEGVVPHHMISADADEIIREAPALRDHRADIAGRAMLCRRTTVFPVECVIRGYISGSAWKEYAASGTLAGEKLRDGLVESEKLEPAIFSPATKAETGHDENITVARVREVLGDEVAVGWVERKRYPSIFIGGIDGYRCAPPILQFRTRLRVLAARCARSFAFRLPSGKKRAQGRPGARCTRGLAGCLQKEMLPTSIQVQRRTSGLPCAMALRLIRDRPGDPAFRDTIALGQLSPPSNLTPASGRRTQSTSPYANKPRSSVVAFASIASHRTS